MDYLLRDSYYCGVPYGKIDLDRLLLSLKPAEGEIIVSEKGRQSIEMYILSRFYMYTQVYLHHTTRAFDIMLKNIFSKSLIKDINYPTPEKGDVDRLINFDDLWLYGIIKQISKEAGSNENYLADCIISRNPIRCVIEKVTFSDAQSQARDPEYSAIKEMSKYFDVIALEAQIDENLIFLDEPWTDLPLENRYHPYTTKPEDAGNKTIKIESRRGVTDIAMDPSSISYYIAKYMAQIIRIYTPLDHRAALSSTILTRHKELEHLLWF